MIDEDDDEHKEDFQSLMRQRRVKVRSPIHAIGSVLHRIEHLLSQDSTLPASLSDGPSPDDFDAKIDAFQESMPDSCDT